MATQNSRDSQTPKHFPSHKHKNIPFLSAKQKMNEKQLLCLKINVLDCCLLTLLLFQFIGKMPGVLTAKVPILLLIPACKQKGLEADLSLDGYQTVGSDFF